jgi:hypothetical protein
MSDTDAACVAFCVKMEKKKTPEPAPLFFIIVDSLHFLPNIRGEIIKYFGYALSFCFWVSVSAFVKQNCT